MLRLLIMFLATGYDRSSGALLITIRLRTSGGYRARYAILKVQANWPTWLHAARASSGSSAVPRPILITLNGAALATGAEALCRTSPAGRITYDYDGERSPKPAKLPGEGFGTMCQFEEVRPLTCWWASRRRWRDRRRMARRVDGLTSSSARVSRWRRRWFARQHRGDRLLGRIIARGGRQSNEIASVTCGSMEMRLSLSDKGKHTTSSGKAGGIEEDMDEAAYPKRSRAAPA